MGVQFAEPRSTAAKYSNAMDFDKASLLSNAQIHAQTSLDNRHAPSSQRGDQGSSPLSPPISLQAKALSEQRSAKVTIRLLAPLLLGLALLAVRGRIKR
jgi:hypothetical protein